MSFSQLTASFESKQSKTTIKVPEVIMEARYLMLSCWLAFLATKTVVTLQDQEERDAKMH